MPQRSGAGIPCPPVPGSPAMHNPRSMIHDLRSTAHDSRSAPRSPIRNLPRSIDDPRITARRPGTSEFTARSLRHAGIPNITILAPAVPPGSPEFTPDRRGVARMPGIQPDPKPKSPSTSAVDQISMQPLPNSLNTPGFGPLTPKSSRRRNEQPSEKVHPFSDRGEPLLRWLFVPTAG